METAILIVLVIAWLVERAAMRRRLDEIEATLRQLKHAPTAPTPTPTPAALPPRSATPTPPAPAATPAVPAPAATRAVPPAPIEDSWLIRRVRAFFTEGNLIVRV